MFENAVKDISLKFEKIKKYTSHNLTIGEYREAVLVEYLGNFISNRFSINSGFVYDHESKSSSKQMDILIIDENYPSAYFLRENKFVVANKNAVVCAIEVKSNFNKEEYKDIIDKCNSIKKIDNKIDFYAFCFKSVRSDLKKMYDSLGKENSIENYPDVVSIFDKGSLKLFQNGDGPYHQLIIDDLGIKTEETSIKVLLGSVMESCFNRTDINNNPYEAFAIGPVMRVQGKLKYGYKEQ
ncbi:DUF6602 domain-containing protein [Desulfoluna sp.]|uniref:DUF6602 domain-containing protein n=1 Tax=Desulfoluna sp. TaxID=2045199 RepID=UPI00260C9254|nr:DUF6602 domain-containing protein [Desulfoluna sp.]